MKQSQLYGVNRSCHPQIYDKMLEDQMQAPFQQPQEHLHQANNSQQDERQQQIQMVIDFGHNASASLMVGPNDDPITLAKKFCFKHSIDPHVISTLASNIHSLQNTTFNPCFRVQKNSSFLEDKQNLNTSNLMHRSRSKSQEKPSSSKMKQSRNKTNQSMNESNVNPSRQSLSGYNVFERLYQDSRKKNTARTDHVNISKRVESSRFSMGSQNRSVNQSSIQSCLQIYQKNTKLKEESILHNQHLYESKKQKEIEECSFKPQINPLSSLIATKLREMDESSILNRSCNDKQMLKIKEYLVKRQQQEMKQCTFKPKILNKLAQNNYTVGQERCKQLYNDHLARESKKQLAGRLSKEKQETYKPEINRISKIIVKKTFYQRLEEDKEKRIEKKLSVQKMNRDISKERRPSTGRQPANRNLQNKTIGQYLYEKSKMSRNLPTKQQPHIFTNPHSELLHTKSKQLAIQYIFELLDSDQDGLISNLRINISALNEEVLKLLAPLLSEMEEVEVELNQQEFQTAFERLYSTFTVEEKNVILKSYKNRQINSKVSENPSFNPSLNEYSLRIARQLCSDDVDIYQSSIARLKEKQNKLNRMRAERMLQEYSECTFHPRIHRFV